MSSSNRAVHSVQEFLLKIIESASQQPAACLERPVFMDDTDSWLEVLRRVDGWKMVPALCDCLEHTDWKNEIPESIRLLFEERTARSKLIQAVLKQECEILLQHLRRGGVEVLLLGRTAFRFHQGQKTLFDSTIIDLASRDTYAFLAALGKRGYRATGYRSAHFMELKHGSSMNRVRVHLVDEEEIWTRSNRITQSPSHIDLVDWTRGQLQTDIEWSKSPEAFVTLLFSQPGQSSHLGPSEEIIEGWFSSPTPWLSRVLKRL